MSSSILLFSKLITKRMDAKNGLQSDMKISPRILIDNLYTIVCKERFMGTRSRRKNGVAYNYQVSSYPISLIIIV